MKDKLALVDIRIPASPNPLLENVLKSLKNKTTKSFYELFMKNRTIDYKHKEKWEEILGQSLNWKNIYTMPFKATIDT